METVSDFLGIRPPPGKGRKLKSSVLIGIEVELENVNPHNKEDISWKKVKDGSLRNNGQEFTLCLWNTSAEQYLTQLFKAFPETTISSRCSIHIHINICSFTLEQIKNLILLYIIFENALYLYSGNRINNIYCVPIRTWLFNGTNLDTLTIEDIVYVFPKYSGLNIIPRDNKGKYLGTVEFRHMIGNKNVSYITTWIDIITQLTSYAQTQDYETLKTSLSSMRLSSEYWNLFQDIFKANTKVLNYSTFDKDVERGITFTKLITG
jgi:hypothetical protein